jgi:hypothetical protein
MPLYEYRRRDTGQLVEVRHRMSETLATWGEVCERTGQDLDGASPDLPVERVMSVPVPSPGSSAGQDFQGCGMGCACARDA